MALTTCPECGGAVSDQAPACPHCGFVLSKAVLAENPIPSPATDGGKDNPKKAKPSKGKIGCGIALGVILAIVVIIIIAAASGSNSDSAASKEIKAFAYATAYIHENYYSDVKLSQKDATISSVGEKYTITGKFSKDGVVHRYSIVLRLNADSASIISCNVT